jgi:hypothetical protein
MTTPRDPDRLIHTFLQEGAAQLHDQVYDAVRADIERRPQRVVIGPWRMPPLNKLLSVGLGAAAVVVAFVIATRVLPGAPIGPGVAQSITPNPSPSPSASPSSAGLAQGPFLLLDVGDVRMTATIAAPAWSGDSAGGFIVKNDNSDAPDGAGLIVYGGIGDYFVYGDPCQWVSTTPKTPATTVDAVVAALAAQASRDASTPVDVSVDGHAGKSITLHVPKDRGFTACDAGEFRSFSEGTDAVRYAQSPGQIDKLWVIDLDGEVVIIDAAYYEGTPQAVVDELGSMAETMSFR